MNVCDTDLELLEGLLDQALDASEAAAMQHRLGDDPDLAAAFRDLRDQRALRQTMFQSLAPDPADSAWPQRMVQGVRTAALRRQFVRRSWRFAGVAAAACLALGFFAGHLVSQPHNFVVRAPAADGNIKSVVAYEVALTNESGQVTAVQTFDTMEKARAFADDVDRWRLRRQQVEHSALVIADHF